MSNSEQYQRIVDEDGGLLEPHQIADVLYGDAIFDCTEQLYGMIWYLAEQIVLDRNTIEKHRDHARTGAVKTAQDIYTEGLKLSPTERYQPFDEGPYEGMSIKIILDRFTGHDNNSTEYGSRDFLAKLIENRIKMAKESGS